LGRKLDQSLLIDARLEKFVQSKQSCRGVTTAATQARAVRNVFLQGNLDSGSEFRRLLEKPGGSNYQIFFTMRDGGIVTGKFDSGPGLPSFERQAIRQRDGRHQSLDFVKAVIAPAFDLERKIDLRRRMKLHIFISPQIFSKLQNELAFE
jgi:hypothetical protein